MAVKVEYVSNVKKIKQEIVTAKDRILEKCGQVAESHAKEYCPVDTGNLRNSITHQRYDENTEMIGTTVHYASYVELGTRKMRAKPYFKPAIQDHWKEYEQIMKSGLEGK